MACFTDWFVYLSFQFLFNYLGRGMSVLRDVFEPRTRTGTDRTEPETLGSLVDSFEVAHCELQRSLADPVPFVFVFSCSRAMFCFYE